METSLFALLFAAALWLGDLYQENKFRVSYPELRADLLPKGAARWKKVLVYKNQALKHIGLFVLWAGVILGNHFSDVSDARKGQALYAAGFLGFVIYLASRMWPTLVEKPRRRR